MKRFFFICFLLCYSSLCLAQETTSGNIIIDIEDKNVSKKITLADMVDTTIEVGKYFNLNYPDEKINTDLKPDIEKFFPELDREKLYEYEDFIRNGIKIFRWGKDTYNDIKSKMLAPSLPVLTYEDKDYEEPSDYTYVDVGENNVLITTDIKKVISYSKDPKEIETYEAYIKRNNKDTKFETVFPGIAKLKKIYEKLELKKIPFYGLIYDDPKTQGEGISPWKKQKHSHIRLATERSRIENNNQIRGVIHFALEQNWLILADKYKNFSAVDVKFQNLQNLKKCDYFLPTPHRINFPDRDLIIYANNVGIPFICEIIDIQQPITINANINYGICNTNKQCEEESSSLSLNLKNGSGFETTLQNFIYQSFNLLPDTQEKDITIRDISVENNPNSPTQETLRLIIDVDGDISNPKIFVKNKIGTMFATPRIAIDGNRISARMDILQISDSLINTPIEITLQTDPFHSYRLEKNISSSSVFDINSTKLNFGLILLALFGGFLLNFMPCVFPVLSLKFLSLTRFGAKNNNQIKKSFSFSILGIYCSFILLASILCILKITGYNLGWGMQFQNPVFLIIMIFAVLLFLAQLFGVLEFNINRLNKLINKKYTPNVEAFLSGILVVIMATPCTGPYLGTTVGFALAGSPVDIFAILLAVATGLTLPYILLLFSPNLSVFIPAPGAWMQKLHKFMAFMLIITIIWLFSILQAQSSWLTILGVGIFALLFYITLFVYKHGLQEAENISGKNKKLKLQTLKVLHIIFISVLSIFFVISLVIGQIGFFGHRKQVEQQTQKVIDFNKIGNLVDQGYNVLVKVGADWCLTCGYNNFLVFDSFNSEKLFEQYNTKVISVDWTEYNPEVLRFMSEYGRRGLPFYVIYNKNIPEGLVLPEILSQMEFEKTLRNIGIFPPPTELNKK